MKLSARDAPGWFAKPDTKGRGVLIHGTDAMRVALCRQIQLADRIVTRLMSAAGDRGP